MPFWHDAARSSAGDSLPRSAEASQIIGVVRNLSAACGLPMHACTSGLISAVRTLDSARTRRRLIDCRKREMKTLIASALLAILAFATSSAAVAERACRPSLSNGYHCPEASGPTRRPTQPSTTSARACRPSLSNLWTCPDTPQPRPRSAGTERPCRPSLSNGYSCPGPSTDGRGSAPPTSERECRPSLSNGYSCPGGSQAGADQYTTEILARAHCPTDTVVWANTRSGVYHFRDTSYYGNTKAGAYMCERAALARGIRAARNEKHP